MFNGSNNTTQHVLVSSGAHTLGVLQPSAGLLPQNIQGACMLAEALCLIDYIRQDLAYVTVY